MAKRKSSKKKSGSPVRKILLTLVVVLVLLLLSALGIIDLEELGLEEANDTGNNTTTTTTNSTGPSTVSGNFYDLYFTKVINNDDEAAHTGAEVEAALIAAIDGTQSTIDAALFELNAPDTTAAIVRALERGVQVRMVLDDEHALEDPESTAEEVIAAGAQVRSDERSALMHNKFFIFDGATVWTGSMNITRNGIYNNNNNALLIKSPELAQNYQVEFDEMFNDGVFSTRGDNQVTPNRSVVIDGIRIETYFSNEDRDEIQTRLVELINGATSSIRVMTFSFTVDAFGNPMIERLNAGVTVDAVFEVVGSLRGQMRPLACAGANVRQDGNRDILHHKVFIIDEAIVATGSFNFSNNALENNNENMLIIHDPTIAAAYTAEWQARFDEGRIPSDEDLDCDNL